MWFLMKVFYSFLGTAVYSLEAIVFLKKKKSQLAVIVLFLSDFSTAVSLSEGVRACITHSWVSTFDYLQQQSERLVNGEQLVGLQEGGLSRP